MALSGGGGGCNGVCPADALRAFLAAVIVPVHGVVVKAPQDACGSLGGMLAARGGGHGIADLPHQVKIVVLGVSGGEIREDLRQLCHAVAAHDVFAVAGLSGSLRHAQRPLYGALIGGV